MSSSSSPPSLGLSSSSRARRQENGRDKRQKQRKLFPALLILNERKRMLLLKRRKEERLRGGGTGLPVKDRREEIEAREKNRTGRTEMAVYQTDQETTMVPETEEKKGEKNDGVCACAGVSSLKKTKEKKVN